jgi:hypothetical protein
MWTGRHAVAALGATLIFVAGLGLGWVLWGEKPKVVETYAPASTQEDGSRILERKPQADATVPHDVPTGGVVERVVQVTIQPTPHVEVINRTSGSDLVVAPGTVVPCPPVRVGLSLVRMPDQTRRVVASSPDGRVVAGVDIPVDTAPAPARPLRWAAGGLYNPTDRTYGAFIDRDLGPLRVGAELFQVRSAVYGVTWAGHVRLGIRF